MNSQWVSLESGRPRPDALLTHGGKCTKKDAGMLPSPFLSKDTGLTSEAASRPVTQLNPGFRERPPAHQPARSIFPFPCVH